jgi:hypothetical protein
LMRNYPGITADMTESVIETLFRRAEPVLLTGLDKAAQYVVHSALMSADYSFKGPYKNTSAGGSFSLSRTIEANPKPTGPSDQFLLTDEIDLTLSLETVIESLSKGEKLETSISPSWERRYVFERPVANREEGAKLSWLLPVQIIFKTNFQNLKNGDMLYVQDAIGIEGSVGRSVDLPTIGGQVPAGVSGYLSANGSYLLGHQLRYTPAGLPTLIVDSGERVTADADLYIRHSSASFYAKIMSKTIASAGWDVGTHQIIAYMLDPKKASKVTTLDKTHLNSDVRAALAMHDYDVLDADFQRLTYNINYTSDSAVLDLGIFHIDDKDSEASDSVSKEAADTSSSKQQAFDPKNFYIVNSKRDAGVVGTDSSCTAEGALEYSSVGQAEVSDGVITIECTLSQGALAGADAETSLRQTAEHFQVADREVDDLIKDLPSTSDGMTTQVSLILPWSQLRAAVAADNTPSAIVLTGEYVPREDSLYGHSTEDAFQDVVQKLAKQGFNNSYRDSLLKKIGAPYVELEVTADKETHKAESGKKIIGRAYQYLKNRAAVTSVIFGE